MSETVIPDCSMPPLFAEPEPLPIALKRLIIWQPSDAQIAAMICRLRGWPISAEIRVPKSWIREFRMSVWKDVEAYLLSWLRSKSRLRPRLPSPAPSRRRRDLLVLLELLSHPHIHILLSVVAATGFWFSSELVSLISRVDPNRIQFRDSHYYRAASSLLYVRQKLNADTRGLRIHAHDSELAHPLFLAAVNAMTLESLHHIEAELSRLVDSPERSSLSISSREAVDSMMRAWEQIEEQKKRAKSDIERDALDEEHSRRNKQITDMFYASKLRNHRADLERYLDEIAERGRHLCAENPDLADELCCECFEREPRGLISLPPPAGIHLMGAFAGEGEILPLVTKPHILMA